MALVPVTLQTGLVAAFTAASAPGGTAKIFATNFVNAYVSYAILAMDPMLNPILKYNSAALEKIMIGETSQTPTPFKVTVTYTGSHIVSSSNPINVVLYDNASMEKASLLYQDTITSTTGSVTFQVTEPSVNILCYYGGTTLSSGDTISCASLNSIPSFSTSVDATISFSDTYTATTIPVGPAEDPDLVSGGFPNSTSEAQAAALIAKGIVKFWTGATFTPSIPPSGAITPFVTAVSSPPDQATLKSNIESTLLVKGNTAQGQAQSLATVIHTATISTKVTMVGVSAPPASTPIVLTNVIS